MEFVYEYNETKDPAFKYDGCNGVCKAVYSRNISKIESGNPFIEALPAMLNSKQILNFYYKSCNVKPDVTLSKEEQALQVSSLSDIRIPLPFVDTLERQFFLSLIESYRKRIGFSCIHDADIVYQDHKETQAIYFKTPMGG